MTREILKIGITGFLMAAIFVSRFICKKGSANGLVVDNGGGSKELNECAGGSCC